MLQLRLCVLLIIISIIFHCHGQEYDFAAEISRQCLVPDPVGLLDCVENKVTLPYLTSWVDCTNSLGQNVKTSTDIINYRCKSVWEGKGVIPEVFYIKDCVIEKTGLPAKNVSAEVLGAYKECESGASNPQTQRTKTAQVQKQQLRVSSVEYKPITQVQAPIVQQFQQPVTITQPSQSQSFTPQQQFQTASPVQPQLPVNFQRPVQQTFQSRIPSVQQQYQVPSSRPMQQQLQVSSPRPVQQQFRAPQPIQQQYQVPASRPIQRLPIINQTPIQQQFQRQSLPAQPQVRPQQAQIRTLPAQQLQVRPVQLTQQNPSTTTQAQYPRTMPGTAIQHQPYSQQYFAIYPQAPFSNQQYSVSQPVQTQKTALNPSYLSQKQTDARNLNFANASPNAPYMYSFQINHPQRPVF